MDKQPLLACILKSLHGIIRSEMIVLLLALSVLLELAVYSIRGVWAKRRIAISLPLIITAFATSAFAVNDWQWWQVFVIYISVFRIINMLRVAKGRMHQGYLRRTARRSSLVLGVVQLLLLVAMPASAFSLQDTINALAAIQLLAATIILLGAVRTLIKSKHRAVQRDYSDKELPTVTVAIPARNETSDLSDCLRSIIANDYPKFEILVLDDCSHDRTPEIIKEFAQDGVRFIKGQDPNPRWLAKNQAYEKLSAEANGEILLFCGVDVRFGPRTIHSLVTTMLNRDKTMVSVMPRRLSSDMLAAFIQPMRYWWEMVVPRRLFNRPAVLSTCWLIDRAVLKKLGGFGAVQHSILPEAYFARELVKTDGYSFVRADDVLDVQTRKTLPAQRETAIRMRYPQLRRRLELVALLVAGELLLLLSPLALALSGFWLGFGTLQIAAVISCGLLVLTHVLIVQVSNPSNVLVAALNYPAVVLVELFLGLTSMFRYEFSVVNWKGRNICEPVMHVTPSLPKA